jgi:hypothetical protein
MVEAEGFASAVISADDPGMGNKVLPRFQTKIEGETIVHE